jgi:hypothetical protein
MGYRYAVIGSGDGQAKAAGITFIPDCGQVPGLGTSLCAYAMTLLDEPRDIVMYDGGIPQHPREPWNYFLTFNNAPRSPSASSRGEELVQTSRTISVLIDA